MAHRAIRIHPIAATLAALALSACASSPPEAPATPAASSTEAPVADAPTVAVPRFERVPVGEAGFEAYVPKGFPAFTASESDDGSRVEMADLTIGDFMFGVIAVKFKEPLAFEDDNEALLIEYLDHLKTVFSVADAAGYGRGQRLESAPDAKGVIDYWRTDENEDISVKGWITRKHIAVFFIAGPDLYPHINVQTMFFEGVRFPTPTR